MSGGGKGSARRPGIIPPDAWERIFRRKPEYPVCGPDGCVCTDDGPGQENEGRAATRPPYEHRKHNREGV